MGKFRLAWNAFWRILTSSAHASAWERLQSSVTADVTSSGTTATGAASPPSSASPTPTAPAQAAVAFSDEAAVYTLTLLQREARLIDFMQEDIQSYSDAQVGAAVRKIHADCRQALGKYFAIQPICDESEQSNVTVPAEFDAQRWRLSGRQSGQPPFAGTLVHRGWAATKISLPKRHHSLDPRVICPAEVELP